MQAAEQLAEQRAGERVDEVKAKVEYKQNEILRVLEAKTAGMQKWSTSLAKIRLCIQVAQHVHVAYSILIQRGTSTRWLWVRGCDLIVLCAGDKHLGQKNGFEIVRWRHCCHVEEPSSRRVRWI